MALRVALMQMDIAWESVKENHARAAAFLERAAGEGCDIAVLPEMFTTGFTMNLAALEGVTAPGEKGVTAPGGGKTAMFLSGMAKRFSINIIAGFAVRPHGGEKGLNLAQAYDREGRCIASYTKNRLFPLLEEERHYEAGKGPVVFDLDGMPSSVFICFDLRFPELFRAVAGEALAVFVIANWPSSRQEHWESLLKARAIENQCCVAGLNRTGTDGNGISYSGSSLVYGPMGELLSRAGEEEEILIARIDPEMTTNVRKQYPFLTIRNS